MNTRGDSGFEIGDDEFRDHEISSLLNQVGGDAPAVGPAHQMVLGRVRTIRRRRTVASSVGALVAVLAVARPSSAVPTRIRDATAWHSIPVPPSSPRPMVRPSPRPTGLR